MVQKKINRGRHIDHPAGCHSIRTKTWIMDTIKTT